MEYIKARHAESERTGAEFAGEIQVAPSDARDFPDMVHVAIHDVDTGEMYASTELERDEARKLWRAIGSWLGE